MGSGKGEIKKDIIAALVDGDTVTASNLAFNNKIKIAPLVKKAQKQIATDYEFYQIDNFTVGSKEEASTLFLKERTRSPVSLFLRTVTSLALCFLNSFSFASSFQKSSSFATDSSSPVYTFPPFSLKMNGVFFNFITY